MGLLSSQIMTLSLTNRRHDLENNINEISFGMMRLEAMTSELVSIGSDLSPDSIEFKKLEERRKKLELVNKQMDQQLKQYQTQLASVEASEKDNSQRLAKNIQSSFTNHLNAGQ